MKEELGESFLINISKRFGIYQTFFYICINKI
jgi:hypothetical protein